MTPAQILRTTSLQPYRNGSKIVLVAIAVGGESTLRQIAERTCGVGSRIYKNDFANRRVVQRQLEPLIDRRLVEAVKGEKASSTVTYRVTQKFWATIGGET